MLFPLASVHLLAPTSRLSSQPLNTTKIISEHIVGYSAQAQELNKEL